LCAGSALGLISSAPIGPINLTIIGTALKANVQRSAAIACAVAVADGIYAFIAASAISMPQWSASVLRNGELFGALLVIGYGLYLIFSKVTDQAMPEPVQVPLLRRDIGIGALTGFALYVANPTFMLFWLGAVSAARLWLPKAVGGNHYIFGIGVILGTATWFFVLLYMVRRSSVLASPVLRRRLSVIAGCLLVIFGAFALIACVNKTS
jgi:threonine/homoserine/homoserine lactone efflux protein